MDKPACIFGPSFREVRIREKISLWKIVHETGGYLATLQRIEKGQTQPGVQTALRLLGVIGVNPGEFLLELVAAHPDEFPPVAEQPCTNFVGFELPAPDGQTKSLFGPILLQLRINSGISQAVMAQKAGYNLRNIRAVEKGAQEPGIITATSLIVAIGFDVRTFFAQLSELYHKYQHRTPRHSQGVIGNRQSY